MSIAEQPFPADTTEGGPDPQRRGRWRSPVALAAMGVAAVAVGAVVAGVGWSAAQTNRTGSVTVAASPADAELLVDGRLVGRTPFTLTSRGEATRHALVVRAPGYRDWSEMVTVDLDVDTALTASLEPEPATVTVTTLPEGAEVRLGPNAVGRTPLVLRGLAPGTYALQVSLPSFRRVSEQVILQPGEAAVRALTLRPSPARLEVRASADGGEVVVDGEPRGTVPLVLDEVEPGHHVVQIRQEGVALGEVEVELAPEELRLVDVPVRTLAQARMPAWVDAAASGEKLYPVAVIVENSPDARPQSGLHSAAVVYEALAEGGISRFMAVFMKGTSEVIGPVRSARHYFVRLAKEFNAPLVHIGASPQGYQAINTLGVPSLDETYGEPGFWRSSARLAPHNAFVSTTSVRQGIGRQEAGTFGGFAFKDSPTASVGKDAGTVAIEYGSGYRVGYEYEPESNTYARYMARLPHVDAETGEHLHATNVVVMTVPAQVIDDEGRLEMAQVGEGRLRVFVDGKVVEGRWRKTSLWAPTVLLDQAGSEVELNPGPTWVQIVPATGTVTY